VELDKWYGGGDVAANLTQAQALLGSGQSFHDIVADLAGRGRWNAGLFPHPEGGAVQGPEFESVAGPAYQSAITLALAHTPPVPIKTFWMTGVADQFEAHITDDEEHVFVTLVVPEVPGGSRAPGSPVAWAVTIADDDQVVVTQTSGPGYDDEEESSAGE
jgi:hypothetical protein